MTTDAHRTIQMIAEPNYVLGAMFMFHPDTLARGKELGLDGFRFYFLGRGGVLGDCDAAIVHSAFGYFHPGLIAKMWNSGRERVAPVDAANAYLACNHALGRTELADTPGLEAYVDAAATIIDAAPAESLALFAGFRAQPVPDDPQAAALHQVEVLRELRGSAHLASVIVCGLPSHVAHAIRRPDDVAGFGWGENTPTVTDEHRDAWHRAEALTDNLLVPAFATLTPAQRTALIDGTAAIEAAFAA
jgi:hypothetical protein